MSVCKKLLDLLNEELIPEVEDFIDNIFELVNGKKASEQDKINLDEARELLGGFKELVEDLESDEVDKEECQETYDELKSMAKDLF
jgi:hypothetical protein